MRLFSDQKKLLLRTYQGSGAQTGDALAEECIAQAYRTIAGRFQWSYLRRRTQINTVAPQSTGTVAYTSSTRVLTLSGATWPSSWVARGLVVINNEVYAVDRYTDSTHITLKADRCPQADIASGTTYILMKIAYVLPVNFVRLERLVQIGNVWPMREMPSGSMLELERLFMRPSRPWQYAIRGSEYATDRMAIEFGPPPDLAYTFDLAYYAKPRARTLSAPYTAGTVSVSGTAVTGTGTTFTSSMVGCVLRQGTADAQPDGEYGVNGSTYENVIANVTDGTHLTLQDGGIANGAVQYVIDDPVDIDRSSMDEVFCRLCEFEWETLTHGEQRREKEKDLVMALRTARAMDERRQPPGQPDMAPTFEALAYANLGGT